MGEVWKDIKGYEGFYQVSNLGRIKGCERKNNHEAFIKKGRILTAVPNSKGYMRVCLKANGKSERFFVHRLVAEHFVEKEDNKNIINHLDCNPKNNNANNLEWTTLKGNSEYMKNLGRNKRTKEWIENLTKSEREKFAKKVVRISENGEEKEYEAVNATKEDGFHPSCVSNCCNGIRGKHKGYRWKFVKERLGLNEGFR